MGRLTALEGQINGGKHKNKRRDTGEEEYHRQREDMVGKPVYNVRVNKDKRPMLRAYNNNCMCAAGCQPRAAGGWLQRVCQGRQEVEDHLQDIQHERCKKQFEHAQRPISSPECMAV